MSTGFNLFLAGLIVAGMCAAAQAAATKPAETWLYYYFDGQAFVAGQPAGGIAYVAMRERVRPVVVTSPASEIKSVALPEDSGVIAGICYIQRAGGKLGVSSGFDPCPKVPLLVSSAGKPFVTVQTDEQGYFLTVLPAGKYTIGSGVTTDEISVDRGITTLIPLRAGKRMVD
jgi:hypothetical protein